VCLDYLNNSAQPAYKYNTNKIQIYLDKLDFQALSNKTAPLQTANQLHVASIDIPITSLVCLPCDQHSSYFHSTIMSILPHMLYSGSLLMYQHCIYLYMSAAVRFTTQSNFDMFTIFQF